METLKEMAIDVLILIIGMMIVTAEGVSQRGLSCGGNGTEISAKAKP